MVDYNLFFAREQSHGAAFVPPVPLRYRILNALERYLLPPLLLALSFTCFAFSLSIAMSAFNG